MKRALALLWLAATPAAVSAQAPQAPQAPAERKASPPAETVAAAPRPSPRPSPTPAPVLEGTVKTSDGRPVEKALVLAQPTMGWFREPAVIVRTDAAGKFRLVLKTAGSHRVRVEAAGWAAATMKEVRPGAPLTVMLQKGAAIEGTVRDGTTSAPLPGATVEAREESGGVFAPWEPDAGLVRAITDARGRFRIDGLAKGLHSVSTRARGYNRRMRTSVPAGGRVDLYLFPGATLVGTVRDVQGGPVAGAVVRAESEMGGFGPGSSSPVAGGPDGRFELTGLTAGTYRVVARHPDFSPGWVGGVTVEKGTEGEVDVVLHKGSSVSGRLVAGEDQPVSGRVVMQESEERPVPMGLDDTLRAEAGTDGRFRLMLPPGSHVLGVVAPGYTTRTVDVEVGGGAPVELGDVTLESGLVIRGRVRDKAGAPIAEAQVWGVTARPMPMSMTRPAEARGEADGTFVLAGLGPGTYRINVRAHGYGDQMKQIDAGAGVTDFVLQPAGSISGVVVDETGAPIEGFRVSARAAREGGPMGPMPRSDSSSAPDGRFLLEDVSEGTWVVEVSAPERANGVVSDVRVTAGSNVDVGRVRLTAGGTVRGLVVDTGGGAVVGATIMVQGAGHDFGPGRETVTDTGGAFELRGVPAGTMDVVAHHPSYAAGRASGVDVDPARGPAEARIVMSQGGRIEGRVTRRDGTGVPAMVHASTMGPGGRRGSGPSTANTGPDGTFVLEHVPVGRTVVAVMAGSGGVLESRHTREVDVREGETTIVDFVFREILLTGHVTRNGVPAPGLRLRLMGAGGGMMMSVGGMGATAATPSRPQRLTGVTDENGAFALLADEPGRYHVNVQTVDGRNSYPSRQIDIPDVDAHTVELAFSGVPVTGIVVDRDTEQPLANVMVGASPREPGPAGSRPGIGGGATTTVDGRFTLELEPGDYRVRAGMQGYVWETADLTVAAGGPASELRLALSRGGVINGRVVDTRGRGIGGLWVGATVADSAGTGMGMRGGGRTLPDGSFVIEGLAAESYTVMAESDAGSFAIRAGVTPGQEDVTLTLRPGGRVQVLVRGPDGAPAAKAFVRVARVAGTPVTMMMGATTSADGMAELMAPGGSVELEVRKDKLKGTVSVNVSPGGAVAAEVSLAEAPPPTGSP